MAAAGAAGTTESRREFIFQVKILLFAWRYPLKNAELSMLVNILYETYRRPTGAEQQKG